MEFNLTILFLIPIGLVAGLAYAYILRPNWSKTVNRLQDLDTKEAEEKRLRDEAERELREGNTLQ